MVVASHFKIVLNSWNTQWSNKSKD